MLTHLRLRPAPRAGFPFDVPALRGVDRIDFDPAVTLLAGENGSGKSTLLEAIAVKVGLPAIGRAATERDASLEGPAALARTMTLAWSRRTRRGFFLRAEDVFGFILALQQERRVLEDELAAAEVRFEGASDYARTLGLGPYRASIGALRARYGENPDARSHGETFLHLFRERIVPGGLYLMDEPEAALSPQSQLALIALMHDAVEAGSQFILATHSPILLAIPQARLLSFDDGPVRETRWEELPSLDLWRRILEHPASVLRHLWPTESKGGGG